MELSVRGFTLQRRCNYIPSPAISISYCLNRVACCQAFFTSFSELHFTTFSQMVTASATGVLEGGHQFLACQQDRISCFLIAEETAWEEEILSSGLQLCLPAWTVFKYPHTGFCYIEGGRFKDTKPDLFILSE